MTWSVGGGSLSVGSNGIKAGPASIGPRGFSYQGQNLKIGPGGHGGGLFGGGAAIGAGPGNAPGVTPIYSQQQAIALQNGGFADTTLPYSQYGQMGMDGGMMMPGMQPGMGMTGGQMGQAGMVPGLTPMGSLGMTSIVYANVQSGLPLIYGPDGKPYPPGYIPTIQDPNSWEQWLPGQDLAQAFQEWRAQTGEDLRQAIEYVARPVEQRFVEDTTKRLREGGKNLVDRARDFSSKDSQNAEAIKEIDKQRQSIQDKGKRFVPNKASGGDYWSSGEPNPQGQRSPSFGPASQQNQLPQRSPSFGPASQQNQGGYVFGGGLITPTPIGN